LEGAIAVENSILDFSVTLAKPGLVRARDAALRMHMAGALAVRARLDQELVKPALVPTPSRRQRKRSLTKVCEIARKAGANRVIVDGVVIAFLPSAAVPESNVNEWDAVLSEVDHGPH
jgi:hypothetical protein